MTFYDSRGNAVAYLSDDDTIYLYGGKPVAYLHGPLVYAFSGKQLGRFENGWVRDNNGCCVFFNDGKTYGGPVKPVTHVKPVKSVARVKSLKSVRQVPRVKSVDSLAWSSLSGEGFFLQ